MADKFLNMIKLMNLHIKNRTELKIVYAQRLPQKTHYKLSKPTDKKNLKNSNKDPSYTKFHSKIKN